MNYLIDCIDHCPYLNYGVYPMSLLKTLKLIKKLRSLFHHHHDCIINALEHHSGTLLFGLLANKLRA